MTDMRYSVMVLPRRGKSILLQSFTPHSGIKFLDGFGSFYAPTEDPTVVAGRVYSENFKLNLDDTKLKYAADLSYIISKSTGLVTLNVKVYIVDIARTIALTDNISWYKPDEIPYDQMHAATGKWLPVILENTTNLLRATIKVDQSGDHLTGRVLEFTIN